MDTTINLLLPTDTAIQLSKIGLDAHHVVTRHVKAAFLNQKAAQVFPSTMARIVATLPSDDERPQE
jgi:hypothetical protein